MSEKIGARIKGFREQKNVSLDELAQRTGLDIDFLRAVEEENLYPSLMPLLKIARSLGQRLGGFLDDHASRDPVLVRVSEREEELTMLKGKGKAPSLRFHSLGKGKADRHMEPFFIEIAPGEPGEEPKLSSHEGEEFIVVTAGRLLLMYGAERHELEPGDSIYFNSVVPHHVGAAGPGKAEIYAVLYFPA